MSIFTLLDAAPAAGSQAGGGSLASLAFTVVAMIAIFYFFLIRPQKKQENEAKKMLEALKKGDKIVTIGGIHGTVFAVKESTVVVKVDDNTKIEFTKNAISKVVNESTAVAEKPAKAEKAEAPAAEEKAAEDKPAKKAAKTTKTTKKTSKASKASKEDK